MRKPVVDYRTFRLSKVNQPQFRHLLYLLGWVGYFCLYFLTENLIPAENCHVMHCAADDVIPFCEYFLVFYVGWYALIVATLIYFALYDPEGFKHFMTFIIVTQVTAMIVYIVYPSRQDLRPTVFPRDNFLTDIARFLYAFDTNTGVCPSLHVAYSVGIASAFLKDKGSRLWWKITVVFLAIMISLSTAFVKQHSVVDIYAAIPFCILAEIIAYGKSYWLPKFKKHA